MYDEIDPYCTNCEVDTPTYRVMSESSQDLNAYEYLCKRCNEFKYHEVIYKEKKEEK